MKVAVSSTGKTIESNVDKVFARCPYFIIADVSPNEEIIVWNFVKNLSAQRMGGAGISAAQEVVEKDVKIVITGNVGPRALQVLKQFKIKIYIGKGKIIDVLNELSKGKLEEFK
jgi:predicted Fe-Mo cluster-binding NifX family protein